MVIIIWLFNFWDEGIGRVVRLLLDAVSVGADSLNTGALSAFIPEIIIIAITFT